MIFSRPVVFADANVLYAAAARDILIELALGGAVRLHWSEEVLREMARALDRRGIPEAAVSRLISAMNAALPDAMVPTVVKTFARRLPDPSDEHVLDSAISCGATHLMTFNLIDFPNDILELEGLRAVHPDAFLLDQLTRDAVPLLTAVSAIQARLTRPVMAWPAYLEALRRYQLAQTADLLGHLLIP